MRVFYRCANRQCYKRRVLSKPIDMYRVQPKCTGCGGTKFYPDRWRQKNPMQGRRTCDCGGYPFPHKEGGGVWCIHSRHEISLEDIVNRYGEKGLNEEQLAIWRRKHG